MPDKLHKTNHMLKSPWHYAIIIASIFAVDFIIYLSGGTQNACAHLMYIPIVFAAFHFDLPRSLIVTALASISLGPWMPLNVAENIMQRFPAWLIRIPVYLGVALIINTMATRLKLATALEQKKTYINLTTGLPNNAKLSKTLKEAVAKSPDIHFSLMVFKFENFEFINRYLGYNPGRYARRKILDIAEHVFGQGNIYAYSDNKFVALLNKNSAQEAYNIGRTFVSHFDKPIDAGSEIIPISANLRCGIVHYPTQATSAEDIVQMLGRSLDQAEQLGKRIVIYNQLAVKNSIDMYTTLLTIYNAIEKDMFYLVYQPKFDMRTDRINGVEALLRLSGVSINPAQIVKIAEDVGLIGQITRLVIAKSIAQLTEWKSQGIHTKVAVNISSQDLRDMSLIEYTRQLLHTHGIDPCCIEFEITERAIIENTTGAKDWLSVIRNAGVRVSLDDFGTGYNSLLNLMDLPVDCIKIDKFFVDQLHEPRGDAFLRGLIKLLHDLDWEIVAEGVETPEQMGTLGEMGCDIIQGYYFSRPLHEPQATERLAVDE